MKQTYQDKLKDLVNELKLHGFSNIEFSMEANKDGVAVIYLNNRVTLVIPDAVLAFEALSLVDPEHFTYVRDESKSQDTDSGLLQQLLNVLQKHCGEWGDSEGAVETLNRIIRERQQAADTSGMLLKTVKEQYETIKDLEVCRRVQTGI